MSFDAACLVQLVDLHLNDVLFWSAKRRIIAGQRKNGANFVGSPTCGFGFLLLLFLLSILGLRTTKSGQGCQKQ